MNVFVDKSEITKNCFWIPEKTPESLNKSINKPSEKLYCPVREYNHFIKMKDLININLREFQRDDKFICCLCNKELGFQKIICIKNCGHVMCRKCLESVCSKDKMCSYCNKDFDINMDIIPLIESGTGFSTHNQVETNKFNPSFKY